MQRENTKTEIILKIYNRLHMRPLTVRSLKEWLEKDNIFCSERSLYRYLDELTTFVSILGEEIEIERGTNNQKKWILRHSSASKQLTPSDISDLYLFYNFIPSSIKQPLKLAMEKIEKVLHEQTSKNNLEFNTNATQSHFYNTNFHETIYNNAEYEFLAPILKAIENRKQILVKGIKFDNTGLPNNIDFSKPLNPVKILFHRGTLHICFYSEPKEELIILALEQLQDFEVLDSNFVKRNIENHLQHLLNNRFGVTHNIDAKIYTIEIEFTEETGNFVNKHHWHPTQQFTQLETGNWLMEMKCGINRELVGWLMMWMSNARVIKPNKLKELVADKLENMLSYYKENKALSFNNTFRNTV
jgi:predicted DNA-binding transcriptional regulator YafY